MISAAPLGLWLLGLASACFTSACFVSLCFTSTFFVSDLTGAIFSSLLTGALVVIGPALWPRSSFSTRAARAELSPAGSSIWPQINSSINLGGVAPRIAVKPLATKSADLIRFATPINLAWVRIRSNWSTGNCIRSEELLSSTAPTIIRSRRRSSRSEAKRFGSCPDSTTRSTVLNKEALSWAASASIASSNKAPSV